MPLTPLQQGPPIQQDLDNGTKLAMDLDTHSSQATAYAQPISNIGSDLDNSWDDRVNMEEPSHAYPHDATDDDEDMSEGGAPLTTAFSHSDLLNAEMDMIDADIMGSENLAQVYMDPHFDSMSDNENDLHYPNTYPNTFHNPGQPYHNTHDDSDESLDTTQAEGMSMPPDGSGLPAAMSELSQQLQHLQEGQEQFEVVVNEQMGGHMNNMEDHWNLSLGDFLYSWGLTVSQQEERRRQRGPNLGAVHHQRILDDLEPVRCSDLRGELCDIQRINWAELGVSRQEATQMRRHTYHNYTNVPCPRNQRHPRRHGIKLVNLVNNQNFFKFRRLDFDHHVRLTHFQLRNVMACANRGHVFYAGKSRIFQWNPSSVTNSIGPTSVVMDLTNPTVQPFHGFPGGIQISTLATAHNILVAGGFCGEYALVNLMAPKNTKHTEGLITDEVNSITNHVQVHLSRASSLPVAAFASNDGGFRALDISTNKFITEHKYEYAINCSAISPDQRLRVMVGDTSDVMITNAETGEVLQCLEGHRDYGFACDWADDGWTVATGNQDKQIKIWDARKWTSSSGAATPLTTIAAEMGGVRKLRFSPLGSGKRVLVAAEPADLISVIDAQTFKSKQTLSFFGEIGGVDFANDGQDLLVANCDSMRGGIIQYERCNFANQAFQSLEPNPEGRAYDWASDRSPARTSYRKSATGLGVNIGHF
ncbi:uncharacterized protein BP5553_06152 [Venustampulla echinocandica]|uniref:Uncharacterized protein n=1 Tax=Venustampulla echinocandica TaxID=2656787 RepID=A0A370TMP0_9HELO|nr:uncharacterized protein BP5553_06152 [Venustampulla echinocandica]RDL36800.1 hypothetical protein BP5553_06152 [Venustampulla echinocandica]